MGFEIAPLIIVLGVLLAIAFGIALLVAVIAPLSRAIGWAIGRVFGFIGGMIRDALRLVGGLITSLVFVPLIAANVLIGRWSAASHYGRAIQAELNSIGGCCYRMLIGHWARLLGLSDLTEGIERRLPEAVLAAPTADRPAGLGPGKSGQFEGYEIIGSLPGGGSGGKLFIARPTPNKLAAFARQGQQNVDRVVIKTFSLRDGSTLPQIVRENRALPAARRLGLILEHELNEERFFYVTRYVPGESLSLVAQRLHAQSGPQGLDNAHLATALSYTADLLRTLQVYHQGGLWHKDVKPDNIIVADGRAHLVDFGLITPLRSSMTLTTHGTEYFRDPEMVRMALRGVKVHEVDGSRFDLYGAGAVMYSLMEDSFPAHAGLSQISKRCPDAVKWIIRRAMTDYDKRYANAELMLADIDRVLASADPFALKPIDLPSMRTAGNAVASEAEFPGMSDVRQPHPWEADEAATRVSPAAHTSPLPPGPAFASVVPPAAAAGAAIAGSPRLRVTDWWTGRYAVEQAGVNAGAMMGGSVQHVASPRRSPMPQPSPRGPGSTAAEQLVRARARARETRERAQGRISARRGQFEPTGINAGVIVGLLVFVALVGVILLPTILLSGRSAQRALPRSAEPAAQDGAWTIGTQDLDLSAWNRSPKSSDRGVQTEVVLLRDPANFATAAIEPIDRAIQNLRESGLIVGGEGASPGETSEQELQRQINTAASLRAAIGIKPFGSAEARTAVQDWLVNSDSESVVVWIARAEDDSPAVWVLASGPGQHAGLSTLVDAFASASPSSSQPVARDRGRR